MKPNQTREDGRGKRRVRQVLDQLRREARAAGHGWVGRLEKALGKHRGWLRQRRWAGSIQLGHVVDSLEVLGLAPARFFRKALGGEASEKLNPLRETPPAIVAKAWQRLAAGTPGDMGRGYLDELDRSRYEKPRLVAERAEELVEHVELEHLPLLLGVAGSSYRFWDMRLDEAEHAIRAGLEIAHQQEDLSAIGNLLQRLAYVVADRGEHAEALRIAEKAMGTHVIAHDMVGVGKSLVDQGMFLFYLGRYLEAIRTTKAALIYLPDAERANRRAALQYLSAFHHKLGELQIAREYATRAEELVEGMDLVAKGKIVWLQAKISEGLHEYTEAERSLKEVVEIFRPIHHGETALATTELVRVQLLMGRPEDAFQTARTIYPLVEHLGSNRIVSAALDELLRAGLEGLRLTLVERVRARLEKARERREWRSLRV